MDGDFSSDDLIQALQDGGYEQPAAASVPEPSCWTLLLMGLLLVVERRRKSFFVA